MLKIIVTLIITLLAGTTLLYIEYCWFDKERCPIYAHDNSLPLFDDHLEMSIRLLTEVDIVAKSKQELRIMRNEVYARYGYRFDTPELQNYFKQKAWYQSTTVDGADLYDNYFSQIERANVQFIRLYE